MHNSFTRLKDLSSRMVGIYRLIAEQQEDNSTDTPSIGGPEHSFDELSQYIADEVRSKIGNEKQIKKIIKRSSTEQGSLNEILFPGISSFPKHIFLIRYGNAVESGIRKFLTHKYTDLSAEVNPLIRKFLDRTIQLDVAVVKDNTYYVSELKYNFNLDTEKIAKVVEKLDLLSVSLKKFYGEQELNTNVSFVSLRYPHADDIIRLKPGFKAIKNQYILGYVDFFKLFNLNVTKEDWEELHSTLGAELVEAYNIVKNTDKVLVHYAV